MIYLEYERLKEKYYLAQRWFDQALTEQERLITKTMPSAISYDKDSVQSSPSSNMLDDYVIEMEEKRVKEKIERMRLLVDSRESLLNSKEKELRKSHDKFDKIYVNHFIDGLSPKSIAKALNYSISQVYRMIEAIKSAIRKDATKCEKKCANMKTEKN